MNWNGFYECLQHSTLLISQTTARLMHNVGAHSLTDTRLRSSRFRVEKSIKLLAKPLAEQLRRERA